MKFPRDLVYMRSAGHCFYCAVPLKPDAFHIEHGLPRAQGGSDNPWNLYAACAACNLAKGPRSQDEFSQGRDRPFFGDLPQVRDHIETVNGSHDPVEPDRVHWDALWRLWCLAAAYRQGTLLPADDPNGWFFTTG